VRTALVIAAVLAAAAGAAAQAPSAVPVRVGGSVETDACSGLGKIAGLRTGGDGFLSVRAAPGVRAAERDRLRNGARVTVCQERGDWLGVVYPRGGDDADCGLSSPRARAANYRGPCRSGWVARRYVRLLAG